MNFFMCNHYKSRYILIVSLFHFFIFIACNKEKVISVNIDVAYVTTDSNFTVPAKVRFINNTSGAENFKWTFEGGEPSISNKKVPGVITFSTVGIHKVTLEASNRDDKKSQTWMIKVDSAVQIDFDTAVILNHYTPVTVNITNKTKGASTFNWTFDEGNPTNSTLQNPPDVTFTAVGNHNITLVVSNGSTKFTLTKTVTVLPPLQVDFTIAPSFEDEDYEAPLTAILQNNSISATNYTWSSTAGGIISDIHASSPTIYFATEGTYNITLAAENGKETKTITKSIAVKANTNIRMHKDIKLGIQIAHTTVGNFYSTKLRHVFTGNDNIDTAGKWIDVIFFGLNRNFNNNKFISPDSATRYGFNAIPMAGKTKFINSQESCGCGVSFTASDFDNMVNDNPLRGLAINPTAGSWSPFTNATVPRIVLFQTADGRKGVIKVKQFVQDGNNSYIIVDIKVQKE